jgi:tripartite-type tricarboxylate transporter receptor subunit TctC
VTAFAPIVEVACGPYVWLVRADAPAANLREFIAWSQRQPGKLNYASPGNGSVHHLATEMLKQTARIDLTHVPYKGGLYTALLAGEVDAMFESMPGPLPHLASGKLRALAVSGEKRLAALPELPTLAEQGVTGIDVNSWWGFVGPAGLSRAIVARLNTEIARVLDEPELRSTLEKWSIEPTPATPEAFGAYIKAQSAQWRAVAEKLGARAQ